MPDDVHQIETDTTPVNLPVPMSLSIDDNATDLVSDKPLTVHPLRKLLIPPISRADYARLVADIRENGLLQPILITPDNEILDGEARQLACQEAGREPLYDVFEGDEALLISVVLSANCARRHLTTEQLALIGAKLCNLHRGRPSKNVPAGTFWTAERAAVTLGISVRSIQRAKLVLDKGLPEIIQALERQEISLTIAEKIAGLTKSQQWRIVHDTRRGDLTIAESYRRWSQSAHRYRAIAHRMPHGDGYKLIYANCWMGDMRGVAEARPCFDVLGGDSVASSCALFVVARATEMRQAILTAQGYDFLLYSTLVLLPLPGAVPTIDDGRLCADQFMLLLWFTRGKPKANEKDIPQMLRCNRMDDNQVVAVLEVLYPGSENARLDLLGHRPKKGWCLGQAEIIPPDDEDEEEDHLAAATMPKGKPVFARDLAARAGAA